MTTLATLQSLVVQGESETLEFKRSTAELRRAGETLCAFLNGEGGQVLISIGSDGRIGASRSPTPHSATSRRCSATSSRPRASS